MHHGIVGRKPDLRAACTALSLINFKKLTAKHPAG
jgi:hypothetical protein